MKIKKTAVAASRVKGNQGKQLKDLITINKIIVNYINSDYVQQVTEYFKDGSKKVTNYEYSDRVTAYSLREPQKYSKDYNPKAKYKRLSDIICEINDGLHN